MTFDFGFQFMPSEYLTVDVEYTHRWSSVPYYVGPAVSLSAVDLYATVWSGRVRVLIRQVAFEVNRGRHSKERWTTDA